MTRHRKQSRKDRIKEQRNLFGTRLAVTSVCFTSRSAARELLTSARSHSFLRSLRPGGSYSRHLLRRRVFLKVRTQARKTDKAFRKQSRKDRIKEQRNCSRLPMAGSQLCRSSHITLGCRRAPHVCPSHSFLRSLRLKIPAFLRRRRVFLRPGGAASE